jgi:hypothetical protein
MKKIDELVQSGLEFEVRKKGIRSKLSTISLYVRKAN